MQGQRTPTPQESAYGGKSQHMRFGVEGVATVAEPVLPTPTPSTNNTPWPSEVLFKTPEFPRTFSGDGTYLQLPLGLIGFPGIPLSRTGSTGSCRSFVDTYLSHNGRVVVVNVVPLLRGIVVAPAPPSHTHTSLLHPRQPYTTPTSHSEQISHSIAATHSSFLVCWA